MSEVPGAGAKVQGISIGAALTSLDKRFMIHWNFEMRVLFLRLASQYPRTTLVLNIGG